MFTSSPPPPYFIILDLKNLSPIWKTNPGANENPKIIHSLWFIFSVKFAPLWYLPSFAENFTPTFQTTPATSFTPVIFPFSANNFWPLFILDIDNSVKN